MLTRFKHKKFLRPCAIALGVLMLVILSPSTREDVPSVEQSSAARLGNAVSFLATSVSTVPVDSMEYRIAERLRSRLIRARQRAPGTAALALAIRERQELLRQSVTAQFVSDDGVIDVTETIALQHRPLWIEPAFSSTMASFQLSEERMRQDLEEGAIIAFPQPVDITVHATTASGTILRADTQKKAASGYEFDTAEAVKQLRESLHAGEELVVFPLTFRHGRITYLAEREPQELTLLATGKSNFRGSDSNRIFNVRKGLRDTIHNVIIPDGAVFSFNDTLGGPVTLGRGWRMALVIFNGDELRPSPGGGICQVSTTTYRAAVHAGLPIIDRRSHSLYVSYYKQYGVGIDATIFPGTQDLTFLNDTGSPIIIQTEIDDAYNAFVHFYGMPDGRSVELTGPLFAASAPEEVEVNGRSVRKNEIVWIQDISFADGQQARNLIVSRYKYIPAGLPHEFLTQAVEQEELPHL